MRNPLILTALALAAMAVTGCSSSKSDVVSNIDPSRWYMHTGPGNILYSPNGEPLSGGNLGLPDCPKALGGWFDRIDADHDGTIDSNEMVRDARVQFLRMDLDGDGAIYPSELVTFRAPFQVANKRQARETEDTSDNKKPRIKADISDPVMSADTNLDFKVTLDEIVAQARDIFASLDRNKDGKLDRQEVLKSCPPGL